MYSLGCRKSAAPRVRIGCGWTTGETGTALADSTRKTGWAADGEAGTAEEATGGVVGAPHGADVEAEVIGATRGANVEAGVVGATCGTKGGAIVVGVAVGPPVSVMRAVGRSDCQPLQRGRSDCLGVRSDRQPGSSVPLRCRRSDHLEVRSDRQPLQRALSDRLEARSDC
jgi:hypothetical protein